MPSTTACARLAERLAAARREVLSVQMLTAEERDFPFRGGHRFRDPETGEELLSDGDVVRADFLARFAAARAALASRLAASGIRHVEYVLDEALDLPLRRLFCRQGRRMTLSLLLPIGLAALAALLLPLLVHLARRSEQRLVPFAALRWLQAKPQPRRKRRFEEHLLLLLRLLLLAALALLLAEPVLFGKPRPQAMGAGRARCRCGAPRVGHRHALGAMALAGAGFPALDAKAANRPIAATSAPATFASLLREADATLPAGTPLTVLVPSVLDGADAERPTLARRVDWRVMPASAARMHAIASKALAPKLRCVTRRNAPHRCATCALPAWRGRPLPLLRQARIRHRLRHRPSASRQQCSRSMPAPAMLVWLVPGALPAAVRDWITAVAACLARCARAGTGARPMPRWSGATTAVRSRAARALAAAASCDWSANCYRRQMPALLEPDFPRQLQRLFATPPPAPARVDASAHAPRTGALRLSGNAASARALAGRC